MTEFETSSTEPSYISRLALQSAPLNTLRSWLRRFDSVQKQIKSMAPVQQ